MATVDWDSNRTKTLSIPSSGTESDVLDTGSLGVVHGYQIGILGPTALDGVITIEVAWVEAGPYRALQSSAADINIPANKATVIQPVPFRYIKIVSSATELAQRDFFLVGHMG